MDASTVKIDRRNNGRSVLLKNQVEICRSFDFHRQPTVVRSAKCTPDPAVRLEPHVCAKRVPLILRDWEGSGSANYSVGVVTKKEAARDRKTSSADHVRIAHI